MGAHALARDAAGRMGGGGPRWMTRDPGRYRPQEEWFPTAEARIEHEIHARFARGWTL